MGMFDSLRIHSPLPFSDEMDPALRVTLQAEEYQTKDLDCALDHYELRSDGTLWRKWWNDPELEKTPEWFHAASVFANIMFYTSIGKEGSGWVDWRMYIVDGKLHRPIELVKYRPVDPAEEAKRAKHLEDFLKKLRDDNPQ